MPKLSNTVAIEIMLEEFEKLGGRIDDGELKSWIPYQMSSDGKICQCVDAGGALLFWRMQSGDPSLCAICVDDGTGQWIDGEDYTTGEVCSAPHMVTYQSSGAGVAYKFTDPRNGVSRPDPKMRGEPVWGHAKNWSAIGRVASRAGQKLAIMKPDGSIYPEIPDDMKIGKKYVKIWTKNMGEISVKRRTWTPVRENSMQGFVALWTQGPGACEYMSYYGATQRLNYMERQTRGYFVTGAGKLQVPGVGHVTRGIERTTEECREAVARGLRDAGPPLTEEVACSLAGELYDVGMVIPDPFAYWFQREWRQKRCARWQDATLFEKYFAQSA